MRRPTIRRTLQAGFLLAGCALVAACSSRQADPFGGSRGPGPARTYRVGFVVWCQGCAINWSADWESGSLQNSDRWSKNVHVTVFGEQSVLARLSAAPLAGSVSRVEIKVNGKTAAEARSYEDGRSVLSVSTPVPPPPERIIAGGPYGG